MMRVILVLSIIVGVGTLLIGVARALEPPAAPSELQGASYLDSWNSILLVWQDNADNEDSYRIERSAVGENGPWEQIPPPPAAQNCMFGDGHRCLAADYGLAADTKYWYRVAAVNEAGMSPYSNVASAMTRVRSTPEPGEIRGLVFHDKDRDGVRDAGEEGLGRRQLTLQQDGDTVQTSMSGSDGEYFLFHLNQGAYALTIDLDEHWTGCSGFEFSYNPLQRDVCENIAFPWDAMSPASVAVSLGDSGATVDFSAEPADAAVLTGDVILETDHAPPGNVITALVNGQECGTTTVTGGRYYDFSMAVLGARERPGCAQQGDLVQFTVGGVPSLDVITYRAFYDPSNYLPQFGFVLVVPIYRNLIVMQNHAWYWFEESGTDLPADGTLVQAVINGVICGETRIETPAGRDIAGFSKLLVPSDELQPGCGHNGATVNFLVDGALAGGSLQWRPGLSYVSPFFTLSPVELPGTGPVPPAIPTVAALPKAGSAGHRGGQLSWPVALFLAAAGGVLIAGARIATARRP